MLDRNKLDFGAEWAPVLDPYWSAIPDDPQPRRGIPPAEYTPADLHRRQPCPVAALMEYAAFRLPLPPPRRSA